VAGASGKPEPTRRAQDGKVQRYYAVGIPLDIAQALLVEGDTFGLAVSDEKRQRQFQATCQSAPNPSHFQNARESGRPSFLVLESEPSLPTAPTAMVDTACRPGTCAELATLALWQEEPHEKPLDMNYR
jgi:hypothetical protein